MTEGQESQELNLVFGALSNPVRRTILNMVSQGDCTVAQLAEPQQMSLNAVSKHIKYLERAGLIHRQIEGSYHKISMNGIALKKAERWMSHYSQFWNASLQNLKKRIETE